MGLLSLSIWLPIAFGAAIFGLGAKSRRDLVLVFSLAASLISFLVTLPLWLLFDNSTAAVQFTEVLPWIESFGIYYRIGLDGISLWFVLLTSFITVIVVIAGWESVEDRVHQYMGSFLVLSGLMVGVFSALDGLLFYVFFEATLIPMYVIIGVWGGPRKIYAAFKFFLYTLLGSLLMLVAIIYLYRQSGGSFDLMVWRDLRLPLDAQILLFGAFLAAFAVKVPMFPVHTWLPDVHVEAPTGGSVVLAAIMLKLGAYGFLRFSLPITPDASRHLADVMIGLSLVAVIYVGLVALVQDDMKRLVAYSSVAHMGFVTLGFFLFDPMGMAGGLVQMISHGFVSGAMFLCIGVLYDRVHSRLISSYGGVLSPMPKFAAFSILFGMANCGLPGTAGFVGEWLVILAAVKSNIWIGILSASALILGAAYTLWMMKRVFYGEVVRDEVRSLVDLNGREYLMLSILAVAVLFFGLYPKPMTDSMGPSVDALLKHVAVSKVLPK